MAYQVILKPGIDQFREFESPRVLTRINSCGTSSCAQTDSQKARERESATLDEKSTSGGIAEPLCAITKSRTRTGGEKGRHL